VWGAFCAEGGGAAEGGRTQRIEGTVAEWYLGGENLKSETVPPAEDGTAVKFPRERLQRSKPNGRQVERENFGGLVSGKPAADRRFLERIAIGQDGAGKSKAHARWKLRLRTARALTVRAPGPLTVSKGAGALRYGWRVSMGIMVRGTDVVRLRGCHGFAFSLDGLT